MTASIEAATTNTRASVASKTEEEKAWREHERKVHLENLSAEAKKRAKVLEEAMEELPPAEQRLVRLHAAVIVHAQGWQPGDPQARLDDMTLKLARYTARGEA